MALAEPTVRGQELGEQLRAPREAVDCSLTVAGQRVDASASTICRIEGDRVTATPKTSPHCSPSTAAPGHNAANSSTSRGKRRSAVGDTGTPDQSSCGRTLQNQETRATCIVNFENTVIPGLLQTSEHMHELMAGCDLSDEEAQRYLDFRQQRHLFSRGATHRTSLRSSMSSPCAGLGGREAFYRRLPHLLRAAERPNITVLVVPNDGRAHAGITGPFILLHKGGRFSVVRAESLTSCLFLEERFEIEQYASAVQRLSKQALSEEQPVELLASLARTGDRSELPDGRQDVDPQQLQQHHQEVAHDSGNTAVRDSKDPDGPHLLFSARTFGKFLGALNEQ